MSFDDCTYVDPETGAPCLKARGHDDVKGGWKCPRCSPVNDPGRNEPFVCKCGFAAQAPSQHLTIVGWGGKAVTQIEPLEKYAVKGPPVGAADLYAYANAFFDGVIVRGVKHEDHCASRKAPPGALLVGPYKCDCGASEE